MTTNEATVDVFGDRRTFECADSVAGYAAVLLRAVVGYWFLHAGWTN